MVAIHDKTPEGRRKLKEGPKAKEKYVEDLYSEWIDNHALKDAKPPKPRRDHEVPESVKARARRHEQDAAERIGAKYNPGAENLLEDFHDRRARQKQKAGSTLTLIMAGDLRMIGSIRSKWLRLAEKHEEETGEKVEIPTL